MAGVTVEATGDRADEPVMLVSNHVSWLDMIAIQSLRHSRFVAKSDVRAWPLIGSIATRLGAVYIDRGSARSAAKVTAELAALLTAGDAVVIFPEGTTTTTDGSTLQPFHAGGAGGLWRSIMRGRIATTQPGPVPACRGVGVARLVMRADGYRSGPLPPIRHAWVQIWGRPVTRMPHRGAIMDTHLGEFYAVRPVRCPPEIVDRSPRVARLAPGGG